MLNSEFLKFSLHWFGFHFTPIARLRSYKARVFESFESAVIPSHLIWYQGSCRPLGCCRPAASGHWQPPPPWAEAKDWPVGPTDWHTEASTVASLSLPSPSLNPAWNRRHTLPSCCFNNQPSLLPTFCKQPKTSRTCVQITRLCCFVYSHVTALFYCRP